MRGDERQPSARKQIIHNVIGVTTTLEMFEEQQERVGGISDGSGLLP